MKIYDCFPIFNELDLLEIRLDLMYNYVDHFIVSECDYTFSGLKKPFYFEENKDRFSKYMDKIIHVKHHNTDNYIDLINIYEEGKKRDIYQNIIDRLNEMRNTAQTDYGAPHWCRDYLHKELTMMAMDVCEPDDLILFGDLDEIPDPLKLKFDGSSYLLNQKNMIYFINTENKTESWYGTYICKFSNLILS
jgi:beta-1,4-mannosyl-glycoprotein beta-1,4-N-acetylglucosaminyltransferase